MSASKRRDTGSAHRQGIRTTLVLLDEALCEMEGWAKGRQASSVLYSEHNTLTPRQRRAILDEVTRMRATLSTLRDDLGLEPQEQTATAAVRAQCSALWEYVAELDGEHLKRYGELPPGLSDYLCPRVAELENGLKRILRSLRR